ncbi:molecular chaperone [Paraflavitalea soli]|uniref:Molecular chaperone n=1 Tax=Paraflavitalea soli TaxID=2315862 RepID=A0A3B7MI98_9BACT|nr:fimbria/pilus periplasmic chaperone [Paraflavitalea soli]AXY72766.1 molecular chaperone [Paraflavitalea soli]
MHAIYLGVIRRGSLFLVTLLTCCSAATMAQGNLMITPRRVVFEGQKKIQELNLANTGNDTARYLISLLEIRMKPDGAFEQVTEPDSGQNFASSFLRFFPRTITLGPGETQTIKIQVVNQVQLQPGEYRSHLYFRAVPPEKPLGFSQPVEDTTGIAVRLNPVFGITIPAIIRTGPSNAAVTISDTKVEKMQDSLTVLNLVFNRTGNMSVYGDLTVDYTSPRGKTTRAGLIRGIAVYTPTEHRRVRVPLDKLDGIDYKSGKLTIAYTASAGNKTVKMAETELPLF